MWRLSPQPNKVGFIERWCFDKENRKKDAKALLGMANNRIGKLKSSIVHNTLPRYREMRGQLTQAVESGWGCTEHRDNYIVAQHRRIQIME